MSTIDLLACENQRSVWIVKPKLVKTLTQPLNPLMFLCR
jgi:hypothetical protein